MDAAQSRAEEILAFARAVAARPQQAPFRLLLVARSAGAGIESAAWWRALQGSRNPLQAAFVSAQHRTLASLPTGTMGVDERRSVFRAARKRFAALLDLPMTTVEPDLGQPAYDTFLFLQIGALVALTSSGEVPTEEAALLDGVLETEREVIWRPTARSNGLGDSAPRTPTDAELDLALAVASLAVTSDRQDAVALLEQFDELRNAGPRERIADWLRDLYPGAGWLRAIRPDRLGERHVATVIAERRDVPRLLLEYGLAALASGSTPNA